MMENFLRLGLLLIAVTIVFLISLEAWHRRRYLKMMNRSEEREPRLVSATPSSKNEPKEEVKTSANSIIMLSVLAKPEKTFSSYDLVQSILATGLTYGEGNLFHYFDEVRGKLFSLASATKTGEFDLDHIGDLNCKGLILFMDLEKIHDAERAFELMLTVAEQLADDLNGELRADPRRPWDDEIFRQYKKRISQHHMVA